VQGLTVSPVSPLHRVTVSAYVSDLVVLLHILETSDIIKTLHGSTVTAFRVLLIDNDPEESHVMEIVDLTPENEEIYFHCLEDWSDEMKEVSYIKEAWYRRMKDENLTVKLATDENGIVGGMIQYMPIENSFVSGEGLYFILCIWVHGYRRGRGNFQGHGMGKALLRAAEKDAITKGAKGIAAWGIRLPFWMKASWFRKRGYVPVDYQGLGVLLWKPFTLEATSPKWFRPAEIPGGDKDKKACITAFINGWCPAQNLTYERVRRVCEELGDQVSLSIIDTHDRSNLLRWGIPDGVYINGKKLGWGPPLSYEKIRKKITRLVR
jgi:GNAT superfamily N-acetyltransferase